MSYGGHYMTQSHTGPPEIDTCQHHWIIATPNGAKSDGHCKHCGSEKLFPNTIDDRIWTSDGFSLSSGTARAKTTWPPRPPSPSSGYTGMDEA